MAKKPAGATLAEKEEAKVRSAAEKASKRSKGKKSKGFAQYYLVIGSFIAVTLLAILLAITAPKKGGSSSSSTSALVNDKSFINGIADDNFTAAPSAFFNKWTQADVKYGLDGVALHGAALVGMAGAIRTCEDTSDVERGALPSSYDVREAWPTCFGAVYDSGNCSSSYAIAAASSLSSRFCIADVNKYSSLRLSPQQVISCDKKSKGCQGGGADSVWSYIERRGLYPEECVPFAGATKAECKTDCDESRKLKSLSHCVLSGGHAEIKREIYNRGPIVAPMYLHDDLLVYSSGVYSPTQGSQPHFGADGQPIIHAVTVLGWGKTKGVPYWLIANSWGSTWGEAGFARVAFDTVLREGYMLVSQPATEEAYQELAKKKEMEAKRKEQAKKERAERDARIKEKQAQREAEKKAAQEEEEDLDLEDLDDGEDVDLDDGNDGQQKKGAEDEKKAQEEVDDDEV